MTLVTYSVPAIHCANCVHTIELEVGELDGVQAVKAELETRNVLITFGPPATEEKIKTLLAEINYPAAGLLTI